MNYDIAEYAHQLARYALYLFFPAAVAPFLAAAYWFKTYPTLRALALVLLLLPVSVLNFMLGGNTAIWILEAVADLLVAGLLIGDFVTVVKRGRLIQVERRCESVASLGQPLDVELKIANRSDQPISLDVADDSSPYSVAIPALPEDDLLRVDSLEDYDLSQPSSFFSRAAVPQGESISLPYRLVWTKRGSFTFDFVALRFNSALRFWKKYQKAPCETVFRVYPNLCQLEQMELAARKSKLFMLGVRRTRRVGQDAEFERLREYTPDDQYKFIDWKATARRNRIIVRDFQTTRNQRVILALDAGRMTMNQSNGVTLFDSALNSMLALAYIALKQGDEVGMMVFNDSVRRFIPPRGGAAHMNALIRGVFNVFPERVESRYDRAFAYLKQHAPKRALVVLATNVLDERNAAQVESWVTALLGAHLPLALFLRERALFDPIDRYNEFELGIRERSLAESAAAVRSAERLRTAEKQYRELDPVDEIERMYWGGAAHESDEPEDLFFRAAAAAEILNWRRKTLVELEAKGAMVLDAFPEEATAPLISKYLEIKARRLL